ncbi:T-SNARE domain-containing protein 1 [Oopsacas minuta]|uniref:t-SNARE domain-containing protein 1 n=1 Tax=Oopsacas minuta TaxID=111878 RepID=A0AAV7JDL5_9METZ|nr:T-SNARE domain-containing protein 1 [Oopsacas minuta]
MDKGRKVNWTKEEEEYALIEAIQDAGDILRGTAGQCAEINKKKTRLWNNVMKKINSIHGNNRDVKDIKKKWNNLQGPQNLVLIPVEGKRGGQEEGQMKLVKWRMKTSGSLAPIGNYPHL